MAILLSSKVHFCLIQYNTIRYITKNTKSTDKHVQCIFKDLAKKIDTE